MFCMGNSGRQLISTDTDMDTDTDTDFDTDTDESIVSLWAWDVRECFSRGHLSNLNLITGLTFLG